MRYKEWENVKLSEIMVFKNGKKRPNSTGNIPIYGGNGILGTCSDTNFENVIIIGRVGAYAGNVFYEKSKVWVSDNAISVKVKKNSDMLFNYYLLSNLDLGALRIGSGQPLLTQKILSDIEVNIPPLDEQRKIGEFLSLLDEKIELNKKINHHLVA